MISEAKKKRFADVKKAQDEAIKQLSMEWQKEEDQRIFKVIQVIWEVRIAELKVEGILVIEDEVRL